MSGKPVRRWRRWLWRGLVAAVVARLLLALFLVPLLAFVAGFFGVTVTMRSASLSLTGLSLRLQDLTVHDRQRPQAPPLLTAQEVDVDLSLGDLLRLRLVVVDAALTGARVFVQRAADGTLLLPAAWTANAAVVPTEPTTPAATAANVPLDFQSPVHLVSARLHDVLVRVEDLDTNPPRRHELTVDVDVRDLGHPQDPGEVLVRLHAPAWFDEAWWRATVTTQPRHLQIDWQAQLRGVLPSAWPLPHDLRTQWQGVHALAATLQGNLTADVIAGSPHEAALTGRLHGALEGDGRPQLGLTAAVGPATGRPDRATVPFTLELLVPGLVDRLQLEAGELHTADGEWGVRGTLRGEHTSFARAQPWLTAHGITLPAAGLRWQAGVDVAFGDAVSARLHEVFVQHEEERVLLPNLAVRDLRAADGGLAIDAVVLTGPTLTVQRLADGHLQVAGIRIASPATGPSATSGTASTAAPFALPVVRVGQLTWTDAQCTFVDAMLQPPARLQLDAIELRGDGLAVGVAAPPGRLVASARVADTLTALDLTATVASAPTSVAAELTLAATGLTGQSLAPWLAAAGLTPVLRDGTLRARAAGRLAVADGGLDVTASLGDLTFRDGDAELLGLRTITGSGVRLGRDGLDLGSWRIDAPRLAVQRFADGGVQALGLRYRPPPPTASPAPQPPTSPPASAEAPPAPTPVAQATTLRHGSFLVTEGQVTLGDDRSAAPQTLGWQAELAAAASDGRHPFEATARWPGALEHLTVRGTWAPTARQFEATVEATGLRGSGLQRLLPEALTCTLADGALRVQAAASHSPDTGASTLQIDGLLLADQGQELLALDHLQLDIATATAERLHVRTLTGRGLRAALAARDAGLSVPGLLLANPSAAAPPPVSAPAAPPALVRLPALTIDALSLQCERVTVRDERAAHGGGEPLVLTGALTLEPWVATPDADRSPPARLQLRASAMPLCREFVAQCAVNPFELAPTIDADVVAKGLDLTALPRLSKHLAKTLAGTTSAGELAATLHARLDLKRRDAQQFDLARPLAGDLVIENLRLLDTAQQTTLGSVAAIEARIRAFDPRTGDLLLRSVDITAPQVDVLRTSAGLELLGLRLLPPAASVAAAGAPPTQPAPASPTARPEVAVDRLQVQGLRLGYLDETTTPPTRLPIADGELELQHFSSRALTESRPFAFHLSLRGGDVPLERRVIRSSMFAGVLGSAVSAVALASDVHEMEPRPFVDEVTADGQLQFVPTLRGQVRSSITAFELAALRGLAKQGGVDITDGLLDHTLAVQLRGHDGIDVRASQVFTWLSLSEPPGGPISTYLRMPAPLDSMLFLLRNEDAEHRLPMMLHVPTAGLSGAAVRDAAAEAFARIVGGAIGGAAGRAAGVFTGALGLGAKEPERVTLAVPFAAGDPLPAAGGLDALARTLADDPRVEVVLTHELGEQDLARAAALATPAKDQLAAQANQLRQRRDASNLAREPLATEVATLYATGRIQEARAAQARLVAHDHALGELEHSLDQVLDMLADDTPRAARRRTETAAAALGRARQAAVAAELQRLCPGLDAARIVRRPPRGTPTAGLAAGGQIVAVIRRRSAS